LFLNVQKRKKDRLNKRKTLRVCTVVKSKGKETVKCVIFFFEFQYLFNISSVLATTDVCSVVIPRNL